MKTISVPKDLCMVNDTIFSELTSIALTGRIVSTSSLPEAGGQGAVGCARIPGRGKVAVAFKVIRVQATETEHELP